MNNKAVIIVLFLLSFLNLSLSGFCLTSEIKDKGFSLSKAYSSVLEIKTEDNEYYGTAVCIKKNLLVTNYHIVNHENNLIYYRSCYDADYKKADLIMSSEDKDTALLSVNDENIVPLSVSTDINNGDDTYSLGNSLNQGISLSKGILSNSKVLYNNNEFICSDNKTVNGNSGGALLNKKAELIGITTFYIEGASLTYSIPVIQIMNFMKTMEV